MTEPLLEMKNITKSFAKVTANRNVSISLYPGEIHALLGENGAGKSTLMNVLTGIYKPDGGEIIYNGKKIQIRSPKHAVSMGIGMVHQHFRLIPTLTVAENVILNSDDRAFFLNPSAMEQEIAAVSKKFDLELDPHAKVWQLSVGEQQRVEIVKLLYRGAEILILDEPSAVLTPQEADSMFETLRKMADAGKAVIVISHKLQEVMKNADRITVMRRGEVVDTMEASEATVERLTTGVVGDQKFELLSRPYTELSPEITLELASVSTLNDKGLPALSEISLDIHRGEIFGIAGVAGNGQKELAELITGIRPVTGGKVMLQGTDITGTSVKHRIRAGCAFIPEDRRGMGLIPELDLVENAILKDYKTDKYSRHGLLHRKPAHKAVERYTEQYAIRHGGNDLPVSYMSGGNQQKLLVAREVEGDPVLIVAAYPVRGLDIGAAEVIRGMLLAQAQKGAAVLLISEELEEIFRMCDRVGVLCGGKLMGVKKVADTNIRELGLMMSGENSEVEHA